MQITFSKELIIILKKRQSHVKSRYKYKNVKNFSLSQKRGFVNG